MMPFILVPPKSGDTVLDLGCGNGRLAMALILNGFHEIKYIGIDPCPQSVEFCRWAFAPWPQFEFWHAPLKTPTYTPNQPVDPMRWVFPLANHSVNWAAAISVFTHLQTKELAGHYADEFYRVLAPSGVFWSTWFRSPPNDETEIVERTVYQEAFIVNRLRGFLWLGTKNGTGVEQHDQWNVWVMR
jgi:ubiquinone/menaquinone biosynthesis C-methylase UbiE